MLWKCLVIDLVVSGVERLRFLDKLPLQSDSYLQFIFT
jgi:hypothetical protein